MYESSIYVSFTSHDSKDIYPDNNGYNFRFKLNKDLILERRMWSASLVNFHNENFDHNSDRVIVCLDGVKESCTGENIYLPCLQRYPKSNSINQVPLYFQLTQDYFQTLHVFVRGDNKKLMSYKDKISTVEILFVKNCKF